MTNPGDSDEWWKQYGGEGVKPESEPSGYPSAPQYPQQPPPQYSQPQYPQPPSQPQYQQPYQSSPQQPYPQQPNYGYPQPPGYQPYGQPTSQGTNGMAIGALVASLIGLCTCSIGSIVGIILGVISLNQLKERPGQDGRGMALAGIWVGAGGIVAWIIYIAVIVASGST
ncbi:DUF4190 domain-containing protein [Nocardia arizonensis]|uniref:DUF4190 domain-containing protein n=1 Tax=Nocardia arizonensis TaxID=1141647 RepID=UPI0006CF4A1B|nr:DUF4190 domain-containing protein [Nocardia arizonensis]